MNYFLIRFLQKYIDGNGIKQIRILTVFETVFELVSKARNVGRIDQTLGAE